jgi:hypothetical protein
MDMEAESRKLDERVKIDRVFDEMFDDLLRKKGDG